MAKDHRDHRSTRDEDEPEVVATEAPSPRLAPHGVPAGLPPEAYMTAQEAHVAGGGEYAPPPETVEEANARLAKETKKAEEDRKRRDEEDIERARKAKKGEK
jgi:hypothetical protein